MIQRFQTDWFLFIIAAGLALFGAMMVYSASAMIAQRETQGASQFTYFSKQITFTVAGIAAMWVVSRFDYRMFERPALVYAMLLLTVVLLCLVFAFPEINGARRWIRAGGFSLQPSELSKISLPVFLAYWLSGKEANVGDLKSTVLPCLAVLAILGGLVFFEPDLGTTIVLCAVFAVMYFAAGAPVIHIASLAGLMAIAGFAAVIVTPWRVERLMAFLDPFAHSDDAGYQVVQSLYALGSGGVFGEGFAQGQQKLFYLPYPYSDFIFSVIGEEWGLIGTLGVVFVFGLFLWRGTRASVRAADRFGMLLGIGLVTGIIVQALFNISVVTSLLPAKGIPLPFVSYGGSSVVVTMIAVGIILSISRISDERPVKSGDDRVLEEKVVLELPEDEVADSGRRTGGHIYPGIAVAKEILRRESDSEVLFVGTARGLETRLVPASGFQLSLIHSAGLKGVGLKGKLSGLSVLPRSFLEARQIIRQFRPHVAVGAGGYVSGPVLLMAAIMGVPTLIMDSNALPGFTNRLLSRFVDKAALTFEEAVPYFGAKAVVTGNPVRREFFDIEPKARGNSTHILVFGGSQGSRAINDAMIAALGLLSEKNNSITITHQTGEADLEKVSAAYSNSPFPSSDVRPFIQDIFYEFAKADLVICRAGATTCAELCAAGKASVMIPLPTAADDHQRKNAEAMQAAGAARMLLQSELSGNSLAEIISELTASPETISKMEMAARRLAKPDAAERTADLIEELKKNV